MISRDRTRFCFGLAVMSLSLGCGNMNTLNSFSRDAFRYSMDVSAGRQVIISRCTECHNEWTDVSDEDWSQDVSRIAAGNADASKLYQSLRGNEALGGTADMPPSGPLSLEERNTIRDWINAM